MDIFDEQDYCELFDAYDYWGLSDEAGRAAPERIALTGAAAPVSEHPPLAAE